MNERLRFIRYMLQAPAGSEGGGGSGEGGGSAESGKEGDKSGGGAGGSGAADKGGAKGGEGDGGELDVSKLDPKAQKLISDLRKENGDWRQKHKGLSESHSKLKKGLVEAGIIEDDSEPAEEKLKTVSAQNEMAVFNNAILESAIEHGVAKDDLDFFRFLVQKEVAALDENAELGPDQIAALAKQARRSKASGSTSVEGDGKGGQGTPPPGGASDTTLEQFTRMNMGEKTALFVKDRATYDKLMSEARSKKLLVG